METLKKILRITAITLAIILSIFILIIIFMMIFPGFKLFGTRFVKKTNVESAPIVYEVNPDEEYSLVANTDNFDIEVYELKDADVIRMTFIDNKWGFTSVATSQLTLKENGSTIEARMLETQGFVFGSGKLKIYIPMNSKIHLNINTNDGDVLINHQKLQSLSVNMTDGNLVWKAEEEVIEEETPAEPTDEPSTEPKFVTKIVPIKSITIDNIIIFTKKANIDLSCFENITANNKFMINSNKLKLNLNTLSSNTQIISPNLELKVKNLNDLDELQIYTSKGYVEIENLECIDKAMILGESGNIKISNAKSPVFASTTSGDVSIIESNANLSVKTTKGKVDVNKGYEDIFIETTSGDINIPEYYKSLNILTKTGDINIYSKGVNSSVDQTNIEQESGDILANTDGNEISINSTNGSNVKIYFRNMSKNKDINHKVSNKNGTTNVYVMLEKTPFFYRATGNVSGELGNIVTVAPTEDYVLYTPTNQVGTTDTNLSSINIIGGNVNFQGLYE